MNLKKILSAGGILVVLALIAVGISFIPRAPSSKQVDILSGVASSTDTVHTEEGEFYTIRVVFPAHTALLATADVRARETIQTELLATVMEFKKGIEAYPAEEIARLNERDALLALDIDYRTYTSKDFVSYAFTIYEDTGGAHPNGYFKTFVFDATGKKLSLSDLFVGESSSYLAILGAEVRTQAVARGVTLGEMSPKEVEAALFKEGYAPKADNFQNFVIDGDRLIVFIPPYQVASYAFGSFEVVIPLQNLAQHLAPSTQ